MIEMNSYLNSAIQQFEYYKLLGEKTIDQLGKDNWHNKISEESNSVYVIVKHLSGNMQSRFADFLTSDGEKEWRNRDDEFEESNDLDMMEMWQKGWSVLLNTLKALYAADLEKIVFIRNEGHTVIEAINRQLCHYAYHVGQIVFIGKAILDKEFKSLSIPKKGSAVYNAEKFAKEKSNKHFTEDEIERLS